MAANKKTKKKTGSTAGKKTVSAKKTQTATKKKSAAGSTRTAAKKTSAKTSAPLVREITFLAILVFGILSMMSLFQMCGAFGTVLSSVLFGLMGAMAYTFPVYLVMAAGFYISNPSDRKIRRKVWFSAILYLCLCGIFQWVMNDSVRSVWEIYTVCSQNHTGGGFFGGLLAYELARALGRGGAFIVILALFLTFFMLISGKLLFTSLKTLYDEREEPAEYIEYEKESRQRRTREKRRPMPLFTFEKEPAVKEDSDRVSSENVLTERKGKKRKKKENDIPLSAQEPAAVEEEEIHIIRGNAENIAAESPIYKEEMQKKFGVAVEEPVIPAAAAGVTADAPAADDTADVNEKDGQKAPDTVKTAAKEEIPYRYPPLTLLNRPHQTGGGMANQELRSTALKLQKTLESFGVKVKMGDISLGPSVTRYELIPEQGVKVSRITGLSDDIKLSLAASDIRIEAPIPGKAAVGIEVPNPERTMITLRELLESKEFTGAKSLVTFAVGKDISGQTIVTDIAKMPHLLIAGATGSGKSVLINTLIMSLIFKASPNDVKLIMIDPKMVELTAYEDIPHLMIPVVKDPKKASAALGWAVAEMTGRYQKFADAGVRDIQSYNAKIAKLTKKDDLEYQKMPQIVIIVDEFADLMMVAPGEVEDAVCRLAQLARAAGIHLVLATQRPSVNVITGLIKANIPSRIALSVSSAVDSRTIIDGGGAEKLLGNGDMLFAPQNLPKPIRVQGAFVSDEERDSVVNFLKSSGNGPSYNEEVTKHIDSAPAPGTKTAGEAESGAPDNDALFAEAGRFIIEKDKASIGLLQRMFRIGFNRAARIMDQLADAGVVGPEEGTKARQILMTKEQFEEYLEG